MTMFYVMEKNCIKVTDISRSAAKAYTHLLHLRSTYYYIRKIIQYSYYYLPPQCLNVAIIPLIFVNSSNT